MVMEKTQSRNYSQFFDLGNEKVADVLIKSGVDVNILDEYGRTALHLAALNGNFYSQNNRFSVENDFSIGR